MVEPCRVGRLMGGGRGRPGGGEWGMMEGGGGPEVLQAV